MDAGRPKGMTGKAGSAAVWTLAVLAVLAYGLAASVRAGAAVKADAKLEEYLRAGEDEFRKGVELDSSDPAAAEEHYRKSILNFEHITREGGIRNGRLYYNIGNAWFRIGDLGRAILNYKRALVFRPNDQNLVQNLEYARSRRVNRVETAEKEKVFKTLFFFHYDIPSRIRLIIFVAAFALAWVAAGLGLFVRSGWLRGAVIAFAAVAAVFLVSLSVERVTRTRRPEGVVVAGQVVARKGDAQTYQPSFTDPLRAGTEFRLLEKRSEWWHVELDDGVRCWIPSAAGELVVYW